MSERSVRCGDLEAVVVWLPATLTQPGWRCLNAVIVW